MRLAVLTFHRAYNCGAMLQAWALRTVLERMGHSVEFPVCNHVGEKGCLHPYVWHPSPIKWVRSLVYRTLYNLSALFGGRLAERRYRRFRGAFLPEREVPVSALGAHYDCLVIGSDQVWSVSHAGKDYGVFCGGDLPTGLPRISYAASYGDRRLTSEERSQLLPQLGRYAAVSVREREAQRELGALGVGHVALTLDPTLLLTAEDYRDAMDRIRVRGPFLYVYWVNGGQALLDTAHALAKRLNVRLVVTPVYVHSKVGAPKGMTLGVSPGRLLAYAQRATYVLAGSFHGTVFGLLFGKPFLSFREGPDAVESRPASLLNSLGIPERLVTPETSLGEMVRLMREPVPEAVYVERLPKLRQQSLDWLRAALEKVAREHCDGTAKESLPYPLNAFRRINRGGANT